MAKGLPLSVPPGKPAERREQIHDVARPPNAPTGSPPPIIFPKAAQVRRDSEPFLGAAKCQTKPGHDFVEDQ